MAYSDLQPYPAGDETAAATAHLRRDGRRRRLEESLKAPADDGPLPSTSFAPFRSLAEDRTRVHRTGAAPTSSSYSVTPTAEAEVANSVGRLPSTPSPAAANCGGNGSDAISVAVIWLGSAAAGLAAFLLAAFTYDRRRARSKAKAMASRKSSRRLRKSNERSKRKRSSSRRGTSGRDMDDDGAHPNVDADSGGGGSHGGTRTLSTETGGTAGSLSRRMSPLPGTDIAGARQRRHSCPSYGIQDLKIDSSSQWGEGVAVIESILEPGSATEAALTPEQRSGLRNVQNLLLRHGVDDREGLRAHIPRALLGGSLRTDSDECESSRYLLSHFGGVTRQKSVNETKRKIKHVVLANSFVHALYDSLGEIKEEDEVFLPAEWEELSMEDKVKLRDMLSWESLKRWDFNVLELSNLSGGNPLLMVGWAILGSPHSHKHMSESCGDKVGLTTKLDGYGYSDEFSYRMETLCRFLRVMEREYSQENPYHNNIHAADVLQTVHSLLQMGGNEFAQADIQSFSILLAAVVHDVGHPGHNNAYQVNAKSDLALRYNDISVLENMHASTAFQLIMGENRDPKINILGGMQPAQIDSVRKIIIDAVLHTDMTKHFAMVDQMKGLLLTKDVETEIKKENSLEVLNFVLHLADVSNPAKPAPMFLEWTDRCLEEFFSQGDLEKEMKLPISPLCDREKTSRKQSQIGFIQYVVQPAYEVLAKALPAMEDEVIPTISDNLNYWKSLQEDKKSKPQAGGEKKTGDGNEKAEEAGSDEKNDARETGGEE